MTRPTYTRQDGKRLDYSAATKVKRWIRAIGHAELERLTGVSQRTTSCAARLHPCAPRTIEALERYLAEHPEIPQPQRWRPCAGCPVLIDRGERNPKVWCAECKARNRVQRAAARREQERQRLAARRAEDPQYGRRPAPPPVAANHCPECGAVRKAQGKLIYCPRRCEAGLVLRRAS